MKSSGVACLPWFPFIWNPMLWPAFQGFRLYEIQCCGMPSMNCLYAASIGTFSSVNSLLGLTKMEPQRNRLLLGCSALLCLPMWFQGIHFRVVYFLFIYLRLCWLFTAARGLFSSCGDRGLLSSCSAHASHCGGFPRCRAWALGAGVSVASVCGLSSCSMWAPECVISSCGALGLAALHHVESSWTSDWTCVSCIGRRILNHWTTREVQDDAFLCSGMSIPLVDECFPYIQFSFSGNISFFIAFSQLPHIHDSILA